MPDFMKAVQLVHNAYPYLLDKGDVEASFTTGFTHTIAIFRRTSDKARSIFAPVQRQLASFNGRSLFVNITYSSFSTYSAYYTALSGVQPPVGSSAALGSRLLDRKALASPKLNQTLEVLAGTQEQFTSVNLVLVGGGQVARDGADRFSGVNPAWRRSYVHNIVARGWDPGADEATRNAVHSDITNVKVRAMKDLAPDTGAYMNEGDRFDPEYIADFYGRNAAKLSAIKRKYDPDGVFYCPTCIGSDEWKEDSVGRLCRVGQV
ncbi:MAG: hypothetical protein L6R41_006434 [Letrouitia leprolyta]|nr:MAG: hypothetical protein L6R41_006434 [Letrouitia leprolyta]